MSMLASVFTGCGNKEIETGSTAGTETTIPEPPELPAPQAEPASEESLNEPAEPDEGGTETGQEAQEEAITEHNYAQRLMRKSKTKFWVLIRSLWMKMEEPNVRLLGWIMQNCHY